MFFFKKIHSISNLKICREELNLAHWVFRAKKNTIAHQLFGSSFCGCLRNRDIAVRPKKVCVRSSVWASVILFFFT
jgi:hypothetical protein